MQLTCALQRSDLSRCLFYEKMMDVCEWLLLFWVLNLKEDIANTQMPTSSPPDGRVPQSIRQPGAWLYKNKGETNTGY